MAVDEAAGRGQGARAPGRGCSSPGEATEDLGEPVTQSDAWTRQRDTSVTFNPAAVMRSR